MAYYVPLVVAVLANVLYHAARRLTPATTDPFLTIGVSFACAARITDVGWGDGEFSEDRWVAEIGLRLRARCLATRALSLKPGDAVRFGGDAKIVR